MIKHRFKWGVMPLMAAALLAVGCTKEVETLGLRIIEKNMTGRAGNSKVAVDFTDLTHNTWVAGGAENYASAAYYKEYISVAQGSSSPVSKEILEDEGNYYIDFCPTNVFSAGYPGVASQTSTSVSLPYSTDYNVLRYITSGTYAGKCNVQFPMVAFGHSGDQSVTFHHATGAIAFDIINNFNNSYTDNGVEYNRFNIKNIVITALDENDDPVNLWSSSASYLTCISNGNGISVVNSGTTNTTIFYLNNNQEPRNINTMFCKYQTDYGDRIHVVIPIPATPNNTKFQIAIHRIRSIFDGVYWWDQGDLIIQRTTPLMNIGLNEIHKLGDFYLAN